MDVVWITQLLAWYALGVYEEENISNAHKQSEQLLQCLVDCLEIKKEEASGQDDSSLESAITQQTRIAVQDLAKGSIVNGQQWVCSEYRGYMGIGFGGSPGMRAFRSRLALLICVRMQRVWRGNQCVRRRSMRIHSCSYDRHDVEGAMIRRYGFRC